MPYYTFRNEHTGEEFDLSMKISERETYLAENPHITQVVKAIQVVDPVGIGVTKPPSDFSKYVLGKIKHSNPHGNAIEKRWNITKEV